MVEMIESVDRAQSGDRRLGCEWRDAGHRGTYGQQPAGAAVAALPASSARVPRCVDHGPRDWGQGLVRGATVRS